MLPNIRKVRAMIAYIFWAYIQDRHKHLTHLIWLVLTFKTRPWKCTDGGSCPHASLGFSGFGEKFEEKRNPKKHDFYFKSDTNHLIWGCKIFLHATLHFYGHDSNIQEFLAPIFWWLPKIFILSSFTFGSVFCWMCLPITTKLPHSELI